MNYDGMSVDELFDEMDSDVVEGYPRDIEKVAALRKACIREASVGVGTVRRAGDSPLPEAPLMFVPWETKDGDYDLILKETP